MVATKRRCQGECFRQRLYRDQPPLRDELVALWQDIGGGLPIADTVAAWIPTEI